MQEFVINWIEEVEMQCFVIAESEEEARKMFNLGETHGTSEVKRQSVVDSLEIWKVEKN